MSLGHEADRIDLRVRDLERRVSEMENREVQRTLTTYSISIDGKDMEHLVRAVDKELSTELYQSSLEQDN